MRSDLLLRLADLLEADAANERGVKFDLGEWGSTSAPENPMSCGTTACAMGIAAFSGAFSDEGLTGFTERPDYEDEDDDDELPNSLMFNYKGRKTREGLDVARKLFDISEDASWWLFLSYGYDSDEVSDKDMKGAKGELMVARRIRAFVAGEQFPPKDFIDSRFLVFRAAGD